MEKPLSVETANHIIVNAFDNLLKIIVSLKEIAKKRYFLELDYYYKSNEIVDLHRFYLVLLATAGHEAIPSASLTELFYGVLDFVDVLYEKHKLYHANTVDLCNKVYTLLNLLTGAEKKYEIVSGKSIRLIRTYNSEKKVDTWPTTIALPEALNEHDYYARRDDMLGFYIALAIAESHQVEDEVYKNQLQILLTEAKFLFCISNEKLTNSLIKNLTAPYVNRSLLEAIVFNIELVRKLLAASKRHDWINHWFTELYLKMPQTEVQTVAYFLHYIAGSYTAKNELSLTYKTPDYSVSLGYRYRKKLNQRREACAKLIAQINENNAALSNAMLQASHQALGKYNQDIRQLLQQLLETASGLLGFPEADYCLLALGSLSRHAMLAYSDIELIVLVNADYNSEQLKQLFALFEFFVTCVHEPNGFHIDNHTQHLATDPIVIDTVENYFIKLLTSDGKARQKHSDEMICSLIHADYMAGDKALFEQYQQTLSKLLLTKLAQIPNYQHWALNQMQRHKDDFNPRLPIVNIDLKNALLKPLTFCVLDLALYHNIPVHTFHQAVTALNNFFYDVSTELPTKLQQAFDTVQFYRCQQHLKSKKQQETLDYINPSIEQTLARIQYEILIPYYGCLAIFLTKNNLSLFKSVWQFVMSLQSHLSSQAIEDFLIALQDQLTHSSVVAAWYDHEAQTQLNTDPLAYWGLLKLAKLTLTWALVEQQSWPADMAQANMQRLLKKLPINKVEYEPIAEDKFFIQAIIANLLFHSATLETLQGYYRLLPVPLQIHFINLLELYAWPAGEEVKQASLTALYDLPNNDGWRYGMYKEQQNFYSTLRKLFQDNVSPEAINTAQQQGEWVVSMWDLNAPDRYQVRDYLLKPEVAEQLFIDKQFQPKLNFNGRHNNLRVEYQNHSIWFKLQPELPGSEYMISQLAWRVSGGGVPPSILVNFRREEQSVAVQMMAHVEGIALVEALEDKTHIITKLLTKIDKISFVKTFIRVLLTNPEDDRGPDYFLVPHDTSEGLRYRLVRIDNDRVFYQPEKTKWFDKQLQVKSIIYCLNEMTETFDTSIQAFLTQFCSLDTEKLLLAWLKDLVQQQSYYRRLFTDNELIAHFQLQNPSSSLLPLLLAPGLIRELLIRLDLMQLILMEGDKTNGLMLQTNLHPKLSNYYGAAFKTIPVDIAHPEYAAKRYAYVTRTFCENEVAHTHTQSRRFTLANVSQSLGLNHDLTKEIILASANGKDYSPQQALQELHILVKDKHKSVTRLLLSPHKTEQNQAQKFWQDLPVRHRQRVLTILAKQHAAAPLSSAQLLSILKIVTHTTFFELNLSCFGKILTDKLLETILKKSPKLTYIDLSNCPKISEKSWLLIGRYCLYIEQIILHNNKQLKKLPALPGAINGFIELKHLDVTGCGLSRSDIGPNLLGDKKIGFLSTLNNSEQQKSNNAYDRVVKFLLVGNTYSRSGKTSCIARFCNNDFGKPVSTVGMNVDSRTLDINDERIKVVILDTPSHPRNIIESYFRGAQAIFFVMDITDDTAIKRIRTDAEWVKKKSVNENTLRILLANKNDLEEERKLSYEEGAQLAHEIGAIYYIECSAKDGTNIEEAFTHAVEIVINPHSNLNRFKIENELNQYDINVIRELIDSNQLYNPYVWYKFKTVISKLNKLEDNLIIDVLRRALKDSHYYIRQTAAELLIQYGLANDSVYQALSRNSEEKSSLYRQAAFNKLLSLGFINQEILSIEIAKKLLDPYISATIRQENETYLQQLQSDSKTQIVEIFCQGLESNDAKQRQLAAEMLIKFDKLVIFETKILYALGRNLINDIVAIAAETLLKQINKLAALEVGRGLTAELNINEKLDTKAATIIIHYGHFIHFSHPITEALINKLNSVNNKEAEEAKGLLQKIIAKNLYGEDTRLKVRIDGSISTYVAKRQAAYKALNLGRMLSQMQRCASVDSPQKKLTDEIVLEILQHTPTIEVLKKDEVKYIVDYARAKSTLTEQYTQEKFLQYIFSHGFFTFPENGRKPHVFAGNTLDKTDITAAQKKLPLGNYLNNDLNKKNSEINTRTLKEYNFLMKNNGLNKTIKTKQESKEKAPDYFIKLVLAGHISGKTNCIKRFTKNVFTGSNKGTLGVDFDLKIIEVYFNKTCNVQIWDLGSSELYGRVGKHYLDEIKGLALFMDIRQKNTFDAIPRWIEWFNKNVEDAIIIPIILIGNCCDSTSRSFQYEQGVELAYLIGAFHYIECSAKENINVHEVFQLLAKAAVNAIEMDKILSVEDNLKDTIIIRLLDINTPYTWHRGIAQLRKLSHLNNKLIIMALRQGLTSPYVSIIESTVDLLIQFNLVRTIDIQILLTFLKESTNLKSYKLAACLIKLGKMSEDIILILVQCLIDPSVLNSVRQNAFKDLEKINQLNHPKMIEILQQELDSDNYGRRYLAAEKLIELGNFALFERKILYTLGINLACQSYNSKFDTKNLLFKIDKLTDRQVGKGLAAALEIHNKVNIEAATKIIEYGHFSAYSQLITHALIQMFHDNKISQESSQAKKLLQKILDEKLYSDDTRLKEYIEAEILSDNIKSPIAYKM